MGMSYLLINFPIRISSLACVQNNSKQLPSTGSICLSHILMSTFTLKALADDILKLFFSFFRQIRPDCSCESSTRQMIHIKCQVIFSLKKYLKVVWLAFLLLTFIIRPRCNQASSMGAGYSNCACKDQGPVVQSVVSLTSSLRVISLTVSVDSIYSILIFFAEKMWVAFALQKLLTFFFQQKNSAYLRITRCKF